MHTVHLVSVFLHVVAAMTWIGGMIFLVVVFVPLMRRAADRAQMAAVFHQAALRFRTVGWVALGTLVVTGIVNLLARGFRLEQILVGRVFDGPWGHVLLMKLSVVLALLALSGVHDFWIGPRAARLAREDASAEERERLRRVASVLGRVTFALSLVAVGFAVSLAR